MSPLPLDSILRNRNRVVLLPYPGYQTTMTCKPLRVCQPKNISDDVDIDIAASHVADDRVVRDRLNRTQTNVRCAGSQKRVF